LFALMLASLVMSASLPRAFGDRGLVFAAADVALTIGRTLLVLAALGRDHHLTKVFGRPLVWWSTTALLWIAGGFADGDARLAIWAVAVLIDYAGLWLGYPVPRLGRTHPRDYTIAGAHMAERCYLFITLALGESILVTGANFGELPSSPATVAAFVIAFIGSVALWWIYFDRAAEAGLRVISTAAEPGRLGLSAYTHVHIPMVAGIIAAAAADELTIAHPGDRVSATTAWVILGGPALYLIGNALFKWALWNDVPRSRLIAILALAALIPVALVSSTLGLLAAATAVVVAVAVWDTRAGRRPAGKA
jgi:low temperature requirement protein LtrA